MAPFHVNTALYGDSNYISAIKWYGWQYEHVLGVSVQNFTQLDRSADFYVLLIFFIFIYFFIFLVMMSPTKEQRRILCKYRENWDGGHAND
jgi:TRAP-type C4-dicarboxylate transport system permease small subunit